MIIGKPQVVPEGHRESLMERVFYDIQKKTYLTVSVNRDSQAPDGFRYDAKYNLDFPMPGVLDTVAEMQTAMKASLEKDPNAKGAETALEHSVLIPDFFGIKRLSRYLSRGGDKDGSN